LPYDYLTAFAFWPYGSILGLFHGRFFLVILDNRLVAWSLGRLVAWSLGRLVAWSLGRLVAWSLGRLVAWFDYFVVL